jgi:DNA-binding PucR family transcriptional regulator
MGKRTQIKIFPGGPKKLSRNAQLVADKPWIVDLDAESLADDIADAVEDEAEQAIRSGKHGRVGGRPRGLRTGQLAASFRHRKPRASGDFRATARVESGADRHRQKFLAAEKERGRDYIDPGRAESAVDKAIARWLKRALG